MKVTAEQGTMIVDMLIGDHMSFLSARSANNVEGFNGFVTTLIDRTKTFCEQHLSPGMEHKNKTNHMLKLKDELMDLIWVYRAGTAAGYCRKAVAKPTIVAPTADEIAKVTKKLH